MRHVVGLLGAVALVAVALGQIAPPVYVIQW